MAGKYKTYTPEFREEVAKMVIETSRAIADVAREYGVSETTVGNWVRAYREEHGEAEQPLSLPERARLRELGSRNRPAGGSCWSARPGSGASRFRNPPAPLRRAGTPSAAGASRAGSTSAGGSRRAPAACWCARATVASAATVHAWPSASSHPARSRSRIISQVPSADQRQCRL